jgi:hypothetical protein
MEAEIKPLETAQSSLETQVKGIKLKIEELRLKIAEQRFKTMSVVITSAKNNGYLYKEPSTASEHIRKFSIDTPINVIEFDASSYLYKVAIDNTSRFRFDARY